MIALALDRVTQHQATKLMQQLRDKISYYKLGPALLWEDSRNLIATALQTGSKLFFDPKFNDIPSRVAWEIEALPEVVGLVTVHLSAGEAMLKAAVAAKGSRRLVGITVLTSEAQVPSELFAERVALAKATGLDGVVCAPVEVPTVRQLWPEAYCVTPNIHLGQANQDQAADRGATPERAKALGSNLLVVGRAILTAPDPLMVVSEIRVRVGLT